MHDSGIRHGLKAGFNFTLEDALLPGVEFEPMDIKKIVDQFVKASFKSYL